MRRLLAGLVFALCWSGATAQQLGDVTGNAPSVAQSTAILTVDIDRLFGQSQFGERIVREYSESRTALATENRRIADALRAEELALAAQRAEMAVAVFRTEAAAFDEKAQGIRRAQDAKERALEETLTLGRDQFLEAARPVLGQLMIERGAFAILDRRSVLLSLEAVDITEAAVARINDSIGDGAPVP